MNISVLPMTKGGPDIDRLKSEFAYALSKTDRQQIRAWGIRSAKLFGAVFVKRIVNLATLLSKITTGTANEVLNALDAFSKGRLGEHLGERRTAIARALEAIQETSAQAFQTIQSNLSSNPTDSATRLFSTVIGFYAGSGGNGNGGIPDLDLMAGIGAHRSIFTHSIIAGAFVETAVMSLVDLSSVIHKELPQEHTPFWDKLLEYQNISGNAFVTGASLGIATHLGIDTTIDGFTPYKDLPISLPMSVHEALMGLNAVAEGNYGLHRMFSKKDERDEARNLHTTEKDISINNEARSMSLNIPNPKKLLPSPTRVDKEHLQALSPENCLNESAVLARQAIEDVHLDPNSLDRVMLAGRTKVENAAKPLRLGVIGEFRAGKSTLINALIGEEVAFVDFLEATPIECVFKYGEKREVTIVYRDGRKDKTSIADANEQLSSRRDDLTWLATLDYVQYTVPSPRLQNFDLWDAPGMGGSSSLKKHLPSN